MDSKFSKEAINDELEYVMSNRTQILADILKGHKPLSSKWVFKKKFKVEGSINKFKVRPVVRGNNQKKHINYFDTHSPVTKVATIRALVALASFHNLLVHQMDVKTAFLNGDQEEEIDMR